MLRGLAFSIGLFAARGEPATGQVPVDLTGTVLESGTNLPIQSVMVAVGAEGYVWTEPDGRFHLRDIPPGRFVLAFDRAGYEIRAFNLTIPDTAAGVIELGDLYLRAEPGPTGVLRGTVHNSVSGDVLPAVLIVLNGAVVAMTDDSGAYAVDSVQVGVNQFEARRVGYMPSMQALELRAADTVTVNVDAQPLPIRLDDVEVVADGDRTIYARGRLGDFYRRRRTTEGKFFLPEEIEKYAPVYLTDILRRVPGVRLAYSSNGRRTPMIRGCRARILLDGLEVTGMTLDDIPPSWVEGIEVHRGAFTPVELVRTGRGPTCGVIAVWTK